MKKELITFFLIFLMILGVMTFIPMNQSITMTQEENVINEVNEMTIYNYKIGETIDDDYPINTHLAIEISTGNMFYASNADNTKVYHLNTTTGTRTQIDVDPNDYSGDDKSRLKNIAVAFHDRGSSIIYFGDCNYTTDEFAYVWSLDYSGSETSPSITEEHTFNGVFGTEIRDIVKIGEDIHVFYYEYEYAGETATIHPNGDAENNYWERSGGATFYENIDEVAGACPDGNYVYGTGISVLKLDMETVDMSAYDGGFVYESTIYVYAKCDVGTQLLSYGYGLWDLKSSTVNTAYAWYSKTFADRTLTQAQLDALEVWLANAFVSNTNFVECCYVDLKIAGNLSAYNLKVINLTDDSIDTQAMGDPTGRTSEMSYCAVIGDDTYFLWRWSDENIEVWKYDQSATTFTEMEDCGVNTDIPDLDNQRGIAISNDNDTLYFVIKDLGDANKTKLCSYVISTDTFSKGGEFNVALMLNRNTNPDNDHPKKLEKGFHLTSLYIYQIPARYNGKLWKISDLTNAGINTGTIVAITDTYLFIKETDGNIELWKFQDIGEAISSARITHYERDYPTMKLEYNSNVLHLEDGMFVQVVGNVRVKGSTSVGVKFEGYIIKPEDDDGEAVVIKVVDLVSPAYYDLTKSPLSTISFTGRSDQFVDLLDDDFDYITKGTYDTGQALDNMTLETEKNNAQFLDELAVGD